MRRVICLLLLTSIAQASKTEYIFMFNTTLICKDYSLKSWSYSMQFFDQDVAPFNGDDPITEKFSQNVWPGPVEVHSQGRMIEDEYFSEFYDVKLALQHTCNPSNQLSDVEIQIEPLFPAPKYSGMYTPNRVVFKHNSVIDVTGKKGPYTIHGDFGFAVDLL